MDVQFLASFVVVVESGSLAEAARRLDLTAAAVASRIHALEAELGTPLVRRSGRVVQPTEAGLKILDLARGTLRSVRDLQAAARGGDLRGELRLGAFVSALTSVLPPLLAPLYAAQPALHIHITPGNSADLCRRVAAGELDAALVVEPPFTLAKNCEWRETARDPIVALVPAAFASRDALDLLRGEPFIRYDRGTPIGQMVDRCLRAHRVWPRERIEVDGVTAIAALVEQGLGVALVPDMLSRQTLGDSLARISLPEPTFVRRIGWVWAPQGPHAAMAAMLMNG